MNFYIPMVYEMGPIVVERVFDLIPSARWDERLHADRFSPREIIAHLADWEPIMLSRLISACENPGAGVPVFDEGQMATDNGYAASDPREQMRLFRERRGESWRWLKARIPDSLHCAFLHPERGLQTVEDQASLVVSHDLYHIEQLSEYLKRAA